MDETRDAARDRTMESGPTLSELLRYVTIRNVSATDAAKLAFGTAYDKGFDAGADWASSRTCVWKSNDSNGIFDTECGCGFDAEHSTYIFKFCPNCGGKITTEER